MIYLATAVSLGLFVWSLRRSRAVETAGSAVALAKSATAKLLDGSLSDAEKERAARISAARLLVHSAAIPARLALAAMPPLAFLALLVAMGAVDFASLAQVLESWAFLAVSTPVFLAALLWRR